MVKPVEYFDPEWIEWFSLTPEQRMLESDKLWEQYLAMGGSLDPEPDPQSPFFFPEDFEPDPADGRAGVHILRRSGV